MENHSNPAFGGITRIVHPYQTRRLGLRGGFKVALGKEKKYGSTTRRISSDHNPLS